MLEFRILGPVEALADGEPVALPRKKQRALLALLLLRVGEVVSTDQLIEELWAGRPPATARDALQNYVSQLRKALGPEVIVTRDPGYLLQAAPEQVDIGRFEALCAEARAAEEAAARATLLREALSLWRGPPLADLAYEAFTGMEAARLEELRAAARGDLADAELALGGHAELLPELEAIVAERPFDERPRAQLMLALYRSGRQADALEAYQTARQTLVSELGLDPSPALRELEQAILRQDAILEAPLAAPVLPEERRKTVTVLFCDLVESTQLAEALDPEVLRRVLDGYFAAARRAIERHGGTVEKFIGDAVMAVFGVPIAHEDDALRALRAALETRDGVAALSEALEREQGLALELRIGLNTGEVYVGDPGGAGLVTGSAVNLAKRLEQAAPSGSIMLGAGTLELVRDAVRVKALRPRKDLPLPAFRLLELVEGAPAIARYLEAPLVGREEELRRLLAAFEEAKREPPSQVVAVVGEPGIGKTRLANELVALVREEALVLTGRCVSYGEGATYLPLREMVEGLDLAAALADVEDGELVVQRVLELVGLAEGTAPAGEGAWAVRRLVEALGQERPLVLVFEDVHWAEPTLLDLVEQLAERASGPILLLCVARPELLGERPSWAERALVLEPLADAESVELLAALPGGEELSAEARQRIVEVAAGNPLFAEQLFAYVAERGSEVLEAVPPSVEALLESRLDLLDADQRALLQRAAVVGREFTHRALAELSPSDETAAVSGHLFELVRRGLVRPARAEEEAFRFHHVLVRDVAYNGLPKGDRARLHERFADWLGGEPDALDEIVGYHLEQAYRYRAELGPVDRRAKQLAADAGARLGAAGMRAWRRNDVPATVNLLGRASELLPAENGWRRELLCELGVAERAGGRAEQADSILRRAAEEARVARDLRVELRARLELGYCRLLSEPEGSARALLEIAEQAIPTFESFGDDRSLGRAWLMAGFVQGGIFGRHRTWEEAAERALVHYRRAGSPPSASLHQVGSALYFGPRPVPEAIERCDDLLRQANDLSSRASLLPFLGGLEAQRGDLERGRELVAASRAIHEELGHAEAPMRSGMAAAHIELLAENHPAAESLLREMCAFYESVGDRSHLAPRAAELAEAIYCQGRVDEAEHWALRSRELAASDDAHAYLLWRPVLAKILAKDGQAAEAEALAREAVRLADDTDWVNAQAKTRLDLSKVLIQVGEAGEAATVIEEAVRLFDLRGNICGRDRALELLRTHAPA